MQGQLGWLSRTHIVPHTMSLSAYTARRARHARLVVKFRNGVIVQYFCCPARTRRVICRMRAACLLVSMSHVCVWVRLSVVTCVLGCAVRCGIQIHTSLDFALIVFKFNSCSCVGYIGRYMVAVSQSDASRGPPDDARRERDSEKRPPIKAPLTHGHGAWGMAMGARAQEAGGWREHRVIRPYK